MRPDRRVVREPGASRVILGAREIGQSDDTLAAVAVAFTADELTELDPTSAIPIVDPGWMLDRSGRWQRKQMRARRSARTE